MKLKVQKENETKEFNLVDSWSDVNLESWAKIVSIKTDIKSEEARETIMALTDMPARLIRELSVQDVGAILTRIADMQKADSTALVRITKIDGVEYGFHPNLDDLTLGEYADLETLIKGELSECLPDIMAILYRPVVERKNDVYSIEAYDGDIAVRREIFKTMKGEQVQAALLFFYRFGTKSIKNIQLYLMELTRGVMEQETQERSSEKSGDGSASSIGLPGGRL